MRRNEAIYDDPVSRLAAILAVDLAGYSPLMRHEMVCRSLLAARPV